jgi:hypothetical protein
LRNFWKKGEKREEKPERGGENGGTEKRQNAARNRKETPKVGEKASARNAKTPRRDGERTDAAFRGSAALERG